MNGKNWQNTNLQAYPVTLIKNTLRGYHSLLMRKSNSMPFPSEVEATFVTIRKQCFNISPFCNGWIFNQL